MKPLLGGRGHLLPIPTRFLLELPPLLSGHQALNTRLIHLVWLYFKKYDEVKYSPR